MRRKDVLENFGGIWGLGRGTKVRIRRALRGTFQDLGIADQIMLRSVFGGANFDDEGIWNRILFAAAVAFDNEGTQKTKKVQDLLGERCKRERDKGSTMTLKRISILMDQPISDWRTFAGSLARLIEICRQNGVAPNSYELLKDLLYWDYPGNYVKNKWECAIAKAISSAAAKAGADDDTIDAA